VSEKHANFIVNTGGANADDVYRLITRIKKEVMRREGVQLQEEIKLVGEMGKVRDESRSCIDGRDVGGERGLPALGAAVSRALARLGHEVIELDAGTEVVKQLAGVRGRVDTAFIVLHGRMGEDGTIQGLLELLEIPYTGSGVMASSMAIDKNMTKQVFRSQGIPVAEDVLVTASEVAASGLGEVARGVSLDLGFPCIVKPNCEGSTVGAGKACNQEELETSSRRR